MHINNLLALLLAVLLTFNPLAQCAKILAIFPFAGPSQYICIQPYLKTLAARGHQLTVISAFPQKQPMANFTDIALEYKSSDYDGVVAPFMEDITHWHLLSLILRFYTFATETVLENKEVQKLIHSNTQFDLLIIEAYGQESLYALAHHFKAHLIGFSSSGTDPDIDELVGNISPVSYTPLVSSRLTDHMDFWQRLENLWLHTLQHIYYWIYFLPRQISYYHKYIPNATLDLREYRKKFSLIMINQHFALSYPRPYVPNAIEVGGMHISHVINKLPADIEAFINASPQGVIYFSLGSNIQSKDLPPYKRDILLKTFASLPFNVLWKFEETELPGKPANVFISKWFPQPDILAHPNVRLFITHGGLLSTIEAIHHAKPVVGIPVLYDQYLNVERAKFAGFGVGVNFHSFTMKQLRSAIVEVLENSSYTEKVRLMSRRYHDQPMKPLDRAIYWREYVLRHNGAPHMRVAAQELNFIQVHSLDTTALLFGGAAFALGLVIWLVVRLLCAFFSIKKGQETKQKQKRQ